MKRASTFSPILLFVLTFLLLVTTPLSARSEPSIVVVAKAGNVNTPPVEGEDVIPAVQADGPPSPELVRRTLLGRYYCLAGYGYCPGKIARCIRQQPRLVDLGRIVT